MGLGEGGGLLCQTSACVGVKNRLYAPTYPSLYLKSTRVSWQQLPAPALPTFNTHHHSETQNPEHSLPRAMAQKLPG